MPHGLCFSTSPLSVYLCQKLSLSQSYSIQALSKPNPSHLISISHSIQALSVSHSLKLDLSHCQSLDFMGCVFLLHQFLSIFARSCLSLNLTRFKLSPSQILLISSRSLTRFKLYLSLTLSNSICLMVSPMVLLNSLPAIPPEDPLGKDTIMQPVLEVIEVLVVVFAMDPSEVTIDAFLFHRGRVIEEIEDMVPNWDLDCGLEEMQLAVLAHCLDTWRVYLLDRRFVARTVVLSSHMYCIGNIRDEFDIYLSLLDEFDFELVYITTRLRDFVEQVDGAQSDSSDSDSSDSDPSESESEEEPWVSLAIDNILRNAMFSESESEEEP